MHHRKLLIRRVLRVRISRRGFWDIFHAARPCKRKEKKKKNKKGKKIRTDNRRITVRPDFPGQLFPSPPLPSLPLSGKFLHSRREISRQTFFFSQPRIIFIVVSKRRSRDRHPLSFEKFERLL